ncbi:twin-arginine translocase TatA/TatE family subunit [Desulforhopalus singaporensis]|uniref:Sec-independent protein translocase protein TatB homolog n=1 Tax=Desulforhopalus singaporensis TaxID=91360 RepID=A0A1H0QNM5_9BACT|nr:twin-arginine translocase TatA/TatE family subunit [Desulforhopalus singaporensis]SDP18973.1 sec-independent protein translocase protein TatB [Desulforhopalus singaporensis]
MFGIGLPEMILIMALALIVVGPDKLPDLARSLAKTIMDLKKTAEGLKESLTAEENPLDEIKPDLEEAAKSLRENLLNAPENVTDEIVGKDGVNSPLENAQESYQDLLEQTGKVSDSGELVSEDNTTDANEAPEQDAGMQRDDTVKQDDNGDTPRKP